VTLPDVIDAVRPSVVQISYSAIRIPREPGDLRDQPVVLGGPLGTGFIVNEEGYVVTVEHVLAAARRLPEQYPDREIHVGVGLALPNRENVRANFGTVGFEVVEEDPRHDLALLKMPSNPLGPEGAVLMEVAGESIRVPRLGVPSIRTDRPRDGDGIAVSGYPLGEPVLVTNQGIIASSWSLAEDETPDATTASVAIPETRDTYLADVQSNPGNSGGPAYSTEDGAVIGVLVAGKLTSVFAGGEPARIQGVPLSADAGLSLVVPARYVCEMLDRHGVPWTRA
jgi:S1-C subfamily serine protease